MPDSVRPHRRQPTRLRRPWDSPGKNTGVGRHFPFQCMKEKSESEVAQSCPTLSDPMDCSLPGSSVYGIFQARVLEWGAIAFGLTKTGPFSLASSDTPTPPINHHHSSRSNPPLAASFSTLVSRLHPLPWSPLRSWRGLTISLLNTMPGRSPDPRIGGNFLFCLSAGGNTKDKRLGGGKPELL